MPPEKFPVELAEHEITLLVEALDAYEYWELGHELPRNEGQVFIPGDALGETDRFWSEGQALTAAQAEAIEQIRTCRALADRLRQRSRPTAEPRPS